MKYPLDEIEDGYKFQQIIAEYFRSLKSERHDFHIADIQVDDNGVGCDDGCDILVEFYFEDAIGRHSHKWIIECKSQKQAVNKNNITNNLEMLLNSKAANGYLLICKNDATSSLKRTFQDLNKKGNHKYVIWNGSQLWHKFISRKTFLQAFFWDYYQENFVNNNAENLFNDKIKEFEVELKKTVEK